MNGCMMIIMKNNKSYELSNSLKLLSQIGFDEINKQLNEWIEQCNEHDYQLRLINYLYKCY